MEEINLIDSHCHLIFENFLDDIDQVACRWRSKGVKKLLHACVELSDIPKIEKIDLFLGPILDDFDIHLGGFWLQLGTF